MTCNFETGFEVEKYLRSQDSDDTKKSALAWLLKLHHLRINENIPKSLQTLSKIFSRRMLFMTELNPASKLKTQEEEKFNEDMAKLEEITPEEEKEAFEKFKKSALNIITQVCVHNSPAIEYKTEYLYMYYNIFICLYGFIKEVFNESSPSESIFDATSFKLLNEFIKIYNDILNIKDEGSIVSKLSNLISKNSELHFESSEQRNNAIVEALKSFMVGGTISHDKRLFVVFWNQVIARNTFYNDYIVSLVHETFLKFKMDDTPFDLDPICNMDSETFVKIEDNIFKREAAENIIKARATKVISSSLVLASIFITYLGLKKN